MWSEEHNVDGSEDSLQVETFESSEKTSRSPLGLFFKAAVIFWDKQLVPVGFQPSTGII